MKAEHFERQVQRVEQERDSWEKKYEVRIYFRIPGRRGSTTCLLTLISTCRRRKRNTRHRKPSWTNWSQAWKGSDFVSDFVGVLFSNISPVNLWILLYDQK